MAIYNVDNLIDEQYEDNSTEDVLDNMLEACEYMMNCLGIVDEDAVDESTATQRHYGLTSKNIGKYTDDAVANSKAGKIMYGNGILGNRSYKNATKAIASGYLNKDSNTLTNKIVNKAADKIYDKAGMNDRQKAEGKEVQYAAMRGNAGASMARYARNGRNVKGDIDALKAKKKAVKEACLNILSALDDIED